MNPEVPGDRAIRTVAITRKLSRDRRPPLRVAPAWVRLVPGSLAAKAPATLIADESTEHLALRT